MLKGVTYGSLTLDHFWTTSERVCNGFGPGSLSIWGIVVIEIGFDQITYVT